MRNTNAILYCCATGIEKEYARERIIMGFLEENKPEHVTHLFINDLNKLPLENEKNDNELIYRFGYLYRVPKGEIDLIINKQTGRISIKQQDEFIWGKDEVLEEIFKMIKKQICLKNVYIKTNLNDNKYLIK